MSEARGPEQMQAVELTGTEKQAGVVEGAMATCWHACPTSRALLYLHVCRGDVLIQHVIAVKASRHSV